MPKWLRAEYILASFIAGIFVLTDVAIVWLFVASMNSTPMILSPRSESAAYEHVITPHNVEPTITSRLGGTTDEKSKAVRQLEFALFGIEEVPKIDGVETPE